MALLVFNQNGIYCRAAGIYIDPWRKVKRALLTHAHADHARSGMDHYLGHKLNEHVLRARLGKNIHFQGVEYGEEIVIRGVRFSFHPAGHVPGSAQIRVEHKGEVWVVSGDYKLENDLLSTAFEPIKCHTFITESTFGLPAYRWRPQSEIMKQVGQWWQENAEENRVSVLYGYSLGKAQRILHNLPQGPGQVFAHPVVHQMNMALKKDGLSLADFPVLEAKSDLKNALIIAPPGASGFNKRGIEISEAFCSGWMAIRGQRKRRGQEQGFALSDHADWPGLLQACKATGAEQILVTHGYTDVLARYLHESLGVKAAAVQTQFEGDAEA